MNKLLIGLLLSTSIFSCVREDLDLVDIKNLTYFNSKLIDNGITEFSYPVKYDYSTGSLYIIASKYSSAPVDRIAHADYVNSENGICKHLGFDYSSGAYTALATNLNYTLASEMNFDQYAASSHVDKQQAVVLNENGGILKKVPIIGNTIFLSIKCKKPDLLLKVNAPAVKIENNTMTAPLYWKDGKAYEVVFEESNLSKLKNSLCMKVFNKATPPLGSYIVTAELNGYPSFYRNKLIQYKDYALFNRNGNFDRIEKFENLGKTIKSISFLRCSY